MAEEATTENTETTETTETTESTEATQANGESKTTETVSDEWREHITDTKLRDHAGKFTSVLDLVGKHYELRQVLSTAIKPLPENATEEQLGAFRKATGVPETAEKYDLPTPEGRDATEADTAFRGAVSEVFHKYNISAGAAKGLSEWWNDFVIQGEKAQIDTDKAHAAETEAALKIEWPGKEFERNKAIANAAAAKLFGDDIDDIRKLETKDGRFVLDNAAFIKMLASVGREMEEGRLGSVMTDGDRDGLQSQADDLEKQIDKAQAGNDGAKAQDLYEKQQLIYQKMYGTGPIVGEEGRAA